MAHLRCTTRKLVMPFLTSRLAERPLCHTVTCQSSHLERLHRRLHEEQEHRRQEQEQQTLPPRLSTRWSLGGSPRAPQPEMPPAPPQGIPATG
jgi:hypothetical protein